MKKTKKGIAIMLAIALFFSMCTIPVQAVSSELPEAVDGVITLTEDVCLTQNVLIDSTITINLNGHKIYNTTDIWDDNTSTWSLFRVTEGGNLTINGDGTLQAKENDCFAVDVVNGGKLTINGGTYVGNVHCIYVYEGEATVNGGTFSIQQKSSTWGTGYEYYFVLNCEDDAYKDGKANITVTGGTFVNYDPSTMPGKGETFMKEGCVLTQDGDNYIVHTHSYSTEWKCDETSHWHECACGAKTDVTEHTTEIRDAKEATISSKGYTGDVVCTVCEYYITQGEEIPALVSVEKETAKVDSTAITQAINSAEEEEVVLNLTETKEVITSAELPVKSIEEVKETNKPLTIETSKATVTIDNKALEIISKEAENTETVVLKVDEVSKDTLNEKQQEAIKNKEVSMVISAEILAGDKAISDFDGGKITVKVPFTVPENEKAEEYKVIYISDNGAIEEVNAKYENGNFIMDLEHFSEYAIVKDTADTTTEDETKADEELKDETPKTGAMDISLYVLAIVAAGALVGAVKSKTSKHSK